MKQETLFQKTARLARENQPVSTAATEMGRSRIAWVNVSALANDIAAAQAARGRHCPQGSWFDIRDGVAAMFEEGPAWLEVDGDESRIRWANGLSFRDPPPMSVRLADGRFACTRTLPIK